MTCLTNRILRLVCVAPAIALVGLLILAPTLGDPPYVQHTQSTIDDMTSQTVATHPADRTRTTIGIGEEVVCSIDSETWEDTDCNTTTHEVEDDTIGDRVWACSSGGTINPTGTTSSDSTTLTADHSPDPTCVVLVHVYDSNTKYVDSYIEKTIPFTIIPPDSITYANPNDDPEWTVWSSGDKYLAAKTLFDVTILPTSVSFYNVVFFEMFLAETDTWPDGSTWYGPIRSWDFMVNQANQAEDTQREHPKNSNKLYNGSEWEDFSPTFSIILTYLNQMEFETPFDAVVGRAEFYHSSRETSVGVDGLNGDPQGPFQAP